MAEAAGEIKVVLTLDGVSYSTGMYQARKQADQFQKATTAAMGVTRAQMAEARGTVMVLGEEIGVHLPRHVQKFIASLPGVAPAMSAAFSAVAIVSIGVAAVEAGKKIYEFIEKNEEAARKNAALWATIERPIRETNDELELTKTKLENAIAKLEHKPQNGMKEAIEEALVAADRLDDKLSSSLDKISTELKAEASGALAQAFLKRTTGIGPGKIVDAAKEQIDQIGAGSYQVQNPGASPIAMKAATGDREAQTRLVIDEAITKTTKALADATVLANQIKANQAGMAHPNESNAARDVRDYTGLLSTLRSTAHEMDISEQIVPLDVKRKGLEEATDLAKDAAKVWSEEFEREMRAVPGRIRALVDSSKDDREYRKRVFRAQTEGVAPPEDLNRDLAGEMRAYIGGYGEHWKQYNEMVAKATEEHTRLRAELALAGVAIGEESGSISRNAAAVQRAALHTSEYSAELSDLQNQLKSVLADKSLTEPERQTQAQGVRNQIGQLGDERAIQSAQDQAAIRATSTLGEFSDKIGEMTQRFTNLGEILGDFTTRTLESLNDALIHVLSTPQNELRGKHVFRHMGAGIAENAGGAALRYSEGELTKLLLGPGKKPLGSSPSNAIWARLVNVLPNGGNGFVSGPGSGFGPGGISTSAFGGGGFNIPGIGSTGGVLGGWLAGLTGTSGANMAAASTMALDFAKAGGSALGDIGTTSLDLGALAGFAEGGMISSNMPVLVGERGPEILAGAAGRHVIPNHELGGVTHHHNTYIDARGSTDIAGTVAALHRAVDSRKAEMHDMALASVSNRNRRYPSGKRI